MLLMYNRWKRMEADVIEEFIELKREKERGESGIEKLVNRCKRNEEEETDRQTDRQIEKETEII